VIKKHIPNLITSGNLLVGCIGIILILQDHPLQWGLYAIIIASLFDFLDGFAARLLRVSSPIGKELDSLADLVTFGLLPGMLIFMILKEHTSLGHLSYLALHIPIFSAFRLAKFNVDTRQSEHFLGLPTPANALFLSSLAFIFVIEGSWYPSVILHPLFILTISFVTSLLLISDTPLLALKFKGFGWQENQSKFILIIISFILILTLQIQSIPLIFTLYFLISKIHFALNK
jgi:CDP-diacylglycerol---serine O-phosphatidyltransferase